MKTNATYFVNDKERPIRYGEINLINPPRRRLRSQPEKEGIEAVPVFCGFCGTDFELMKMGREGALDAKFPAGETRLINGHEGVVWVPDENRFAIVLIRGGDSCDPTQKGLFFQTLMPVQFFSMSVCVILVLRRISEWKWQKMTAAENLQ